MSWLMAAAHDRFMESIEEEKLPALVAMEDPHR
jgi:hypothetical protein